MLTNYVTPDIRPVEEEKLPRIYKLLQKLIILASLFFCILCVRHSVLFCPIPLARTL